jgi:flagellar basal body-associated protein FliL
VYVPLEPFTVNLQLEEHPQFLQAGLSLKVADSAVGDALKVHMPEVRDRILLMLSARKASELLTVEGKRKLGADIVDAINAILSPAAPAVAPVAKVAKETPPAAEGETPAPAVAEGEEKPAEEAAAAAAPASAPAPAAPLPIVSVLFTSFIIQ